MPAHELSKVEPKTLNQSKAKEAWDAGYHLGLFGSAGTGKTFLAMYLAFQSVFSKGDQRKIYIVRSIVPTRDAGFLPGTIEEKFDPYTAPYRAIVNELFDDKQSYNKLTSSKRIEFLSTSFIRGLTLDNCIIIVDECQNLTFHEFDSIMTRIGVNTKIIFAGDFKQSDLIRQDDKNGILRFISIIEQMKYFKLIEFNWSDIIRSDIVRDYIITKEQMDE
jgi:phosphate starvation-inducible PhoH-like protein